MYLLYIVNGPQLKPFAHLSEKEHRGGEKKKKKKKEEKQKKKGGLDEVAQLVSDRQKMMRGNLHLLLILR